GDAVDDGAAQAVTLLASFDDGATWNVQSERLPNTGAYDWTVPRVSTSQARIAIVVVYGTDEAGVISESEIAESERFSIAASAGVDGGTAAFALRSRNPASGSLTVRFSLA